MADQLFIGIGVVVLLGLFSSLKLVWQFQNLVVFTLGKYSYNLKPGLKIVIPFIQSYKRVDVRTRVFDVPSQDAITKDNVSLRVNAVLYYRIQNANDAVIKVQDFNFATSQLATTTMRDVVGQVTLDELLSKRDQVSKKIRDIIDKATDPWGIKVLSVDLKHVELPEDMKRVMAKAAEAERLRRAVIIRSEGDAESSKRIAQAAKLMGGQQGALMLRTLQSLNDIASDGTNNVNFFVPLDTSKAYWGFKK